MVLISARRGVFLSIGLLRCSRRGQNTKTKPVLMAEEKKHFSRIPVQLEFRFGLQGTSKLSLNHIKV